MPEDSEAAQTNEKESVDQNQLNGLKERQSVSVKSSLKKASKKRARKQKKRAAKKGARASAPQKRQPRSFPAVTLEEALAIPHTIRANNGGNPWVTDQVAAAVKLRQSSNEFFYLAGGAVSYGLTTGGWKAEKVELTDLGRAIVYAPNAEVEGAKKIEAFLNIEVFSKVLEHYKGSDLPEMRYLSNTLENDFGIPPEQHEQFSRIFRANCDFLGIRSGFTITVRDGQKSPTQPQQGLAVAGPSTVTLAEPEEGSKLVAFVIMPFSERDDSHPEGFFHEVLRSLITPAARDAGFVVRTANRHGSDVIQSTIINDLLEADLVIADLTEHNPNVLFELGVRMANDLPVALIKASGTGQVFDVDNMLRVYPYNRNLWATTIGRDLPNLSDHIKGAWETRKNENTYMKILRRGVVLTSPMNFEAFPTSVRVGR